jgi:phage shock protein PspC (stress-responsive transcriptional regulator)
MRQPVAGQVRHQLREWSRDLEEKKIAGVCAGISSQLDIPVTVVRAIFVLLALPNFSSVGIVAYLTLWFLMPASPDQESGLDRVVAAVNRLTGEALFDPTGREDASQDRAPSYHDPL